MSSGIISSPLSVESTGGGKYVERLDSLKCTQSRDIMTTYKYPICMLGNTIFADDRRDRVDQYKATIYKLKVNDDLSITETKVKALGRLPISNFLVVGDKAIAVSSNSCYKDSFSDRYVELIVLTESGTVTYVKLPINKEHHITVIGNGVCNYSDLTFLGNDKKEVLITSYEGDGAILCTVGILDISDIDNIKITNQIVTFSYNICIGWNGCGVTKQDNWRDYRIFHIMSMNNDHALITGTNEVYDSGNSYYYKSPTVYYDIKNLNRHDIGSEPITQTVTILRSALETAAFRFTLLSQSMTDIMVCGITNEHYPLRPYYNAILTSARRIRANVSDDIYELLSMPIPPFSTTGEDARITDIICFLDYPPFPVVFALTNSGCENYDGTASNAYMYKIDPSVISIKESSSGSYCYTPHLIAF